MKKITFLIGLLILVLGFVFGIIFSLSYNFGKSLGCQSAIKQIKTECQTKENVPNILRAREEISEEMFSYIGEITKIEDQSIILKVRIPGTMPSEEEKFETKKVKITKTTEIVKLVEKTLEEIQEKPVSEAIKEPFKEEKISLFDLKPGDEIIVRSEEDIKEKELVALKISKLPLIPQ